MILVDTSVIADIFTRDPDWFPFRATDYPLTRQRIQSLSYGEGGMDGCIPLFWVALVGGEAIQDLGPFH